MAGLAPQEIVVLLGILVGVVLWIWALADCALRCPRDRRAAWILIVAIFNAAGALLYLVFRQRLLGIRAGERAAGG